MSNRDWGEKDFYGLLGVRLNASEADIKKAYRELARKYHPDLNPGDTRAEKQFKAVAEAYNVLSSTFDRGRYDQVRSMSRVTSYGVMRRTSSGFARHRATAATNMGPRWVPPSPGKDVVKEVVLSSRDARRGILVNLQVEERGMPTRTVIVYVKPGTQDGTMVTMKGRGGFGIAGGPSGDLRVNFKVLPSQMFGLRKGTVEEQVRPAHEPGYGPAKLTKIPGAVRLVAHVLLNPDDVELNEILRRHGEDGMSTYARAIIKQRRGKV